MILRILFPKYQIDFLLCLLDSEQFKTICVLLRIYIEIVNGYSIIQTSSVYDIKVHIPTRFSRICAVFL